VVVVEFADYFLDYSGKDDPQVEEVEDGVKVHQVDGKLAEAVVTADGNLVEVAEAAAADTQVVHQVVTAGGPQEVVDPAAVVPQAGGHQVVQVAAAARIPIVVGK